MADIVEVDYRDNLDKLIAQHKKYLAQLEKEHQQLTQLQADTKKLSDQGTAAIKSTGAAATKAANDITHAQQAAIKETNNLSNSLKKVGGAIAASFAIDNLISFGKELIAIRAEFERYEAVLTNTLGSNSLAKQALDDIQRFAAQTPFSVAELTESFVKLANQGFTPTLAQMRQLGDVAASQGKSFDQLTEAIIDAQTGEFERLKEFGIRASKEGDKVTFAFKGVKQTVDFTNDSIRDYVLSLGDAEGVSGGMAAISATLGGQLSNLGDNFDQLKLALSESDGGGVNFLLGLVNDTLQGLTNFIKTDSVPTLQKLGAVVLGTVVPGLFEMGVGAATAAEEMKALEASVRSSSIDQFVKAKLGDVFKDGQASVDNYKRSLNELIKSTGDGTVANDTYRKLLFAIEAEERRLADERAKAAEAKKKADEKAAKDAAEAAKLQKEKDEAFGKELGIQLGIQRDAAQAEIDLLKMVDEESVESLVDRLAEEDRITREAIAGREQAAKEASDYEEQKAQELADAKMMIANNLYEALIGLATIAAQDQSELAAFQKALALFQIGVDTSRAISGLVATTLPKGVAGIVEFTAGLAVILTNIAKAKALLSGDAPQPPGFLQGVIDLQPGRYGKPGKDSIPARLAPGESVMTSAETRNYKAELTAMRKGMYEDMIAQKYVLPALMAQQKADGLAANVSNAMYVKQLFDDSRLVKAVRKNSTVEVKGFDRIAKEMARTGRDSTLINRS